MNCRNPSPVKPSARYQVPAVFFFGGFGFGRLDGGVVTVPVSFSDTVLEVESALT